MKLPLFGLGLQGKTPVVTAKLLTNMYAEFRPMGEKSQVIGRGFPGLDLFVDFGDTPARGHLEVQQNSKLYVVHRATLWEINNAGVAVSRGTLLTTTGAVYMAHNGTQLMMVDGDEGYVFNVNTLAFAQITDVDFPDNPTSVTWTGAYFVAGFDDGSFYIATDALVWDALDFATAEGDPDRLMRVFGDHGQLILFGDISTEFWAPSGGLDFPFSKLQGADAEWGLAARDSAVKFDNSVALLCKNRMGQVIVGKISGNNVEKISTPDLDTIINAYGTTIDAVGFSYLLNGHTMYQINFPSAQASWSYDGSTKIWSKRTSFGKTYHKAMRGTQYLSATVVSDADNGRLYRMNENTLTENGERIDAEIIGEHWDNELEWIVIDKIRVDVEVGPDYAIPGSLTVWDGGGTVWDDGATLWDYQEETPAQIMLQLSRDGGKSWGTEQWRSMGALGDYKHVCEFRRLGRSRRWAIKVRITDPVRKVIMGCYVNPQS
jgi:hypothetical protein